MSIIREMRQVCQLRKMNRKGKIILTGHWYNKYFTRYFSIYLTWFFVKLGVTANTVTMLALIAALAGVGLCVPHVLWMTILGTFLLWTFEVLDCVDGEVARWTKKSSVKGFYLDLVSHVLCDHLEKAVCALHLYFWKGQIWYLALAFIIYAASATEHGIRKCFSYVNVILPDEAVSLTTYSQCKSRKEKFCHLLLVGFNMSLRHFNIKLISLILIFIAYAGYDVPLIVFCGLLAVYGTLGVVIRIGIHYFFQLPDIPHEKKV